MSQTEYPECPRCNGDISDEPCATCGGCRKDIDAIAAAFWRSEHGEAVREAAEVALATFLTSGRIFDFASPDEVEEFTEGAAYRAVRTAVVRAWQRRERAHTGSVGGGPLATIHERPGDAANARLIAAAPRLLSAVQSALGRGDDWIKDFGAKPPADTPVPGDDAATAARGREEIAVLVLMEMMQILNAALAASS